MTPMGLLRRLFGRARAAHSPVDPDVDSLAPAAKPLPPAARRDEARDDELQLIYLSRFLKGRSIEDAPEHWADLLGESPRAVNARYLKYGDLVPLSLARTVEHSCTVPKLKELLKKRGLKTGGRKGELVRRLLAADETAISRLYSTTTIVECSPETRDRVEKYLAMKQREYGQFLGEVTAALRARQFLKASHLTSAYESRQLRTDPPNPLAISAGPREATVDAQAIEQIFRLRPKLLRDLAEADWESLHLVTGLNYLFGGRVSAEGLPAGFTGVPHFDPATVVRMMNFALKHSQDLERMRRAGVRQAKIACCNAGSCEPCLMIHGKRFALDRIPELPYEKCTCELGCRCLYLPVVSGFD